MDRSTVSDLLDRLHRRQGEFYAGGDDSELRRLLTEDIAWHVPGASPIAGDHRGLEEVLAYFTRRRSLARGTMRMHRRELLVGGREYVASVTDGTATVGGVEHAWSTVGLYRIVGGRIAECWLLPLDPLASTSSGVRRLEGLRQVCERAGSTRRVEASPQAGRALGGLAAAETRARGFSVYADPIAT